MPKSHVCACAYAMLLMPLTHYIHAHTNSLSLPLSLSMYVWIQSRLTCHSASYIATSILKNYIPTIVRWLETAEYKSLFKCSYLSIRLYASAYDFVVDIAATLAATIPFRLLLLPYSLTHTHLLFVWEYVIEQLPLLCAMRAHNCTMPFFLPAFAIYKSLG